MSPTRNACAGDRFWVLRLLVVCVGVQEPVVEVSYSLVQESGHRRPSGLVVVCSCDDARTLVAAVRTVQQAPSGR